MIYIACPEKYATGGTELMHQLYKELKKYTDDIKLYYYNYSNTGCPINAKYLKYDVSYVIDIEDNNENIIIVPEVATDLFKQYRNIKRCIYWLSVDNYFKSMGYHSNLLKLVVRKVRLIFKGSYFGKKVDFKDSSILHLFQSHYAKEFLINKGADTVISVSDPIGSNFLVEKVDLSDNKRENRVLYNPRKGFEFTNKIMDYDSSIEFIPLETDLSQNQIIDLFKTSKVYIDFGNHPGKDRFPREAIYLGCAVITGMRGSAKHYQDVMIPEKFKIDDDKKNIPLIVDVIKNVFENYNSVINEYKEYRIKVINEVDEFEHDVKTLWEEYLKWYSKSTCI